MMKKILAVLLVLAAAGAVFFAAAHFAADGGEKEIPAAASAAGGPSAVSSSVSSAASAASLPASSSAIANAASLSQQDAEAAVQTRIPMDWDIYSLKESQNKASAGGTLCRTFEIWRDDYRVGPQILLAPDGSLYTRSYRDGGDTAPVPAAEDAAFGKEVHTVTGTLTEQSSMMSFFIRTADGTVLEIPKYGAGTDAVTDGSVAVGQRVRVSYTGVIRGDDMCRAFVTKAEPVR